MTGTLVTVALVAAAARPLPADLIKTLPLVRFDRPAAAGRWRGETMLASGRRVGKFVVNRSDSPCFVSVDFASLGVKTVNWDILSFRYKIDRPGLAWWGVKIIDYPLADGREAVWQISDAALLKPGRWHTAAIDIHRPRWRWGGKPNKSAHVVIFRAKLAPGAGPVTILLDDVNLQRRLLRVEEVATSPQRRRSGELSRFYVLRVINEASRPARVEFAVGDRSPQAVVEGAPRVVPVAPGKKVEVRLQLSVPAAKAARLSRYTAEVVAREAASGAELSKVVMTMTVPLGKLPHPVLLLRRDEIPEVLEAARQDEACKHALEAIIREADGWLKRPLNFPDRGGQWWHWYTCKKCGARLRTESPTRHVCPKCGAVYSGWPYDDVVLARQHSALASAVRTLGLAYLLTGREQYARRAAEILLGYSQRYEKYPLHDIHGRPGRGARVGPQTLDEAVWLIPIAQGFDAIQQTLSDDERRQIIEHLLLPAAKVTWSPRMPIHNISCWRNSAYALVGMALDDNDMVDAAVNGPAGFREQIRRGVIPPGFWYEGSWGYHFYTLSALLPFVEAAVRAGIDVLSDAYRGMYEAPVRFVAPDLRLPAFNDSGYVNLRAKASLYQIAARLWPDSPEIAWAASLARGRDWASLIWGARKLSASRIRFASRLERDAGYMIFRANPWDKPASGPLPANYLVMDFGPHGGGHGHPDKLNIVWWAYGKLLAPDAGSIAYGNPMHRGYYKQTLAHNTVVVDGRSQRPSRGKLVFFGADGDLGVGCATADEAYAPVRLTRIIAVSGQRLFDIFIASDKAEHRYELVYHIRGELGSDLAWQQMARPPEGAGYSWCKGWRRASVASGHPVALQWRSADGVGVVMQHLPRHDETLLTALGHDQPPTELVPLVAQRVKGRSAVWVNVLQAFSANSAEAPRLRASVISLKQDEHGRPKGIAVEASDGAASDVVLVNLDGGELEAGRYRLRGQAAMLHYSGGKLAAALCVDGSGVWADGRRVR